MPKYNSICKKCGKEYYSCKTCNNYYFRWKVLCCSVECFQQYMMIDEQIKGDKMSKSKKLNMAHPLRGVTYENNLMHDFKDYSILSESDNWLKSTLKDRIYVVNDVQYLYIPRITFLDIINDIREDAYSEGYDNCKKDMQKGKRKLKKNSEENIDEK